MRILSSHGGTKPRAKEVLLGMLQRGVFLGVQMLSHLNRMPLWPHFFPGKFPLTILCYKTSENSKTAMLPPAFTGAGTSLHLMSPLKADQATPGWAGQEEAVMLFPPLIFCTAVWDSLETTP